MRTGVLVDDGLLGGATGRVPHQHRPRLGSCLDPRGGGDEIPRHHALARGTDRYDRCVQREIYETAYIERNVTGYYPVELADVTSDKSSAGKNREKNRDKNADQEKGFSLLAEDKDGTLYKRTYGFSGYHVRLISKTPIARRDTLLAASGVRATNAGSSAAPEPGGWWQKMMRRWRHR